MSSNNKRNKKNKPKQSARSAEDLLTPAALEMEEPKGPAEAEPSDEDRPTSDETPVPVDMPIEQTASTLAAPPLKSTPMDAKPSSKPSSFPVLADPTDFPPLPVAHPTQQYQPAPEPAPEPAVAPVAAPVAAPTPQGICKGSFTDQASSSMTEITFQASEPLDEDGSGDEAEQQIWKQVDEHTPFKPQHVEIPVEAELDRVDGWFACAFLVLEPFSPVPVDIAIISIKAELILKVLLPGWIAWIARIWVLFQVLLCVLCVAGVWQGVKLYFQVVFTLPFLLFLKIYALSIRLVKKVLGLQELVVDEETVRGPIQEAVEEMQ